MKGLLYYKQRDIRLEEIPKPVPADGEVLIKVTEAGLCQTQINEFIEGPYLINHNPHPLTGKAIPLVPGHEFGGIIEAVGTGVDTGFIGRQAAVTPLISCGECYYCRDKRENVCDKLAYYGLCGENGGFAEYAVVNKNNIHFVEKKGAISFIEPLLVAVHSTSKIAPILNDKKICILGAGPIGICIAAILRDYYKADVTLNDILPQRHKKAGGLGFKTKEKNELQKEYDIVYDCAGNDPYSCQSALLEGIGYLKKGGFLINIGTYFHPVSFVPAGLLINEFEIRTSFAYDNKDIEKLDEVMACLKIEYEDIIERIPLDKIIEDGYYRAEVDKDSFVRLVVTP